MHGCTFALSNNETANAASRAALKKALYNLQAHIRKCTQMLKASHIYRFPMGKMQMHINLARKIADQTSP